MKILLLLLTTTLLCACSASSSNTTSNYQMPPELAGCKVFYLQAEGLNKSLYVVKCPGGSTTTQWDERQGKHGSVTYSVTTQDGQ